MKKRQLKNFIIYPKFQLTLLIANISVTLITLLVVNYKAHRVFERLYQLGKEINLNDGHPYFNFISTSGELLYINLRWAFGLSLILTIITTIYISHRIAGPIYNLKQFFTEIVEGAPFRKIKFRKGDYYSELPELINNAIEKIKRN